MNKIYLNLKIRTKLVIAFVIVAIIAGIVGLIGIININHIDNEYSDLFNVYGTPLKDIGDAEVAFQRIRVNTQKIIIEGSTGNISNIGNYESKINELYEDMIKSLTLFDATMQSEESKKEMAKLQNLLTQYIASEEKIAQYVKSKNMSLATEVANGDAVTLAQSIEESAGNLKTLKVTHGTNLSNQLTNTTRTTILSMIGTIAIAMLLAVILGLYNSSIISKPLIQMVNGAEKLALGDVNVSVELHRKDEVGQLAISLGKMVENIRAQALAAEKIAAGDFTIDVKVSSDKDILGNNLRKLVNINNDVLYNVFTASEQVSTGSEQVASASQMLSQSSTEQATSVEEISATIEEVATQIKQNADFANQTITITNKAGENITVTTNQMSDVVKAMDEINQASEKMSKIIKVIDDISFQTNILALNAAVEAAHAGEYGKGFAVVAEEVRNLAAKSRDAAKDTTELIESSINKAEMGKSIVNETSKSLVAVKEAAGKIAEYVDTIAAASNEQDIAMNQIAEAIMQISQAVQTNSATAEESAAASEELSSQAILLKGIVSKFKLNIDNRLAEEAI